MAYTWTNGELITADKLNNTGGGGGLVVYDLGTIDKSYNELKAMVDDGITPQFVIEEEDGVDIYYDVFYLTNISIVNNEYQANFYRITGGAIDGRVFIQSSADDPMTED